MENLIARVIAEYKGAYKVKIEDEEYLVRVTGEKMFKARSREEYPSVGDFVELDESKALILNILPRKTIIKRKYNNRNEVQVIATNIDVAFIVESINDDFSLNRFERYFAIAKDGGVKPVIILNKIDLISEEELLLKVAQIKERFKDIDIIKVSTVSKIGLEVLRNYIEKGKTYCFLGSSGVGKSSLINELLNKKQIKTNTISSYKDRGKHTTTSRQMYFLEEGGIVIDNPGMREIGMAETKKGIDDFFEKISLLAKDCKYNDCSHTSEKGCRVLLALENGELDKEQYSNYLNLKKEEEYFEMNKYEKREKDRRFGKLVKRAKEDLENL